MSKKIGLNLSKVEEMLDNEMVKDILDKKEEVEDMNNTEMKEQEVQDMKEEVKDMNNIEMREQEIQDMKEVQAREIFEEEREKEIMLNNLHYNIKKAIYISKD